MAQQALSWVHGFKRCSECVDGAFETMAWAVGWGEGHGCSVAAARWCTGKLALGAPLKHHLGKGWKAVHEGHAAAAPGAAHARDPCPDRFVPPHLASVLQDAEGGSEGDFIQEDDDENFIEEDEAGAGPVSSSVIQEDDGPREEEASAAAAASTAEDLTGGKSKFRRGGPVAKAGGLLLGGSAGWAYSWD